MSGVSPTHMIEVIHQRSRVKQDAAIGIVFSTLFALLPFESAVLLTRA